jgi:hypothetical protein
MNHTINNIDLDVFEHKKNICNDNYEYTLVKGFVQSGKSFFMIYQSIEHCLNGYNCIILLRNKRGDLAQLKYRFSEIITKNKLDEKIKIKTVNEFIHSSNEKSIVLALSNSIQLQKLTKMTIKYELYNTFIVFIDEVDYIDTEIGDKKSQLIEELKLFSRHVYGISATVTDPILQEDLFNGTVKILKPMSIYKNINNIKWYKIPEITVEKNLKYQTKSIFKKEPYLKQFLDKFNEWKPVFVKEYQDYHPVIYLIKCTRLIKDMYEIQDYIKEKYNTTCIVYNGDGLRIYIPSGKFKNLIASPSGYYHYKGSIAQAIGYLKIDGGYKKYPKILIISGDLASRGISFVSDDYGKCLENNTLGWHIIGEYFNCVKNLKQPELLQALRLCGNIKDNIELRMYTTENLKNDIIKAYDLAELFMKKGLELSFSKKLPVRDILMEIEIPSEKMIKGRKIARNKNNNDIEKNIRIIHDCNVKKTDILCILYNTLTPLGKKYYNYFVDVLKSQYNNCWVEKSVLMNLVGEKYGINQQLLTNTSHPWHDINKKLKKPHYTVCDENKQGLLFKFINGKWFVMFVNN